MNLDQVKEYRGLTFIEKGMKVKCYGKYGIITGGNSSGNIDVKFEGQKYSSNCHPMSCIIYYDKDGNIIIEYRD